MEYYYLVKHKGVGVLKDQYYVVDDTGEPVGGMFPRPQEAIKEAYVTLKYFMTEYQKFCIVDAC